MFKALVSSCWDSHGEDLVEPLGVKRAFLARRLDRSFIIVVPGQQDRFQLKCLLRLILPLFVRVVGQRSNPGKPC